MSCVHGFGSASASKISFAALPHDETGRRGIEKCSEGESFLRFVRSSRKTCRRSRVAGRDAVGEGNPGTVHSENVKFPEASLFI